jgi:hypothetical protein
MTNLMQKGPRTTQQFPAFLEDEASLPCSHMLAIFLNLETGKSTHDIYSIYKIPTLT